MTLVRDRRFWAGLLPPLLAGGVSWGIGRVLPVLGGPVVAILLGLLVGQLAGQRPTWSTGVRLCSKQVLQGSIVLLGASMSLVQVAQVGRAGLPVMLGTILLAVGAGLPLARLLKVDPNTGGLVTYGTTICGASAIATMSQVMAAPSSAVAVSVGVIVLYNVLAAVVFPLLGQLMHLDASSFGLWAGTAVNDTSSVVAAAASYDQSLLAAGAAGAATGYAVVVKLTRTLMIVPLALFQQWYGRRDRGDQEPTSWWRLVPTFLLLFVVAAAARTVGLVPASWGSVLTLLAHLGTTVAMAAVGMSSSFRQVRDAGWRPLALGGVLWLLVAAASLGLQAATGQLRCA